MERPQGDPVPDDRWYLPPLPTRPPGTEAPEPEPEPAGNGGDENGDAEDDAEDDADE